MALPYLLPCSLLDFRLARPHPSVQTFEANSWVWVTDPKDMFLPAKVVKSFKPGEEGQIKFEDGKVRGAWHALSFTCCCAPAAYPARRFTHTPPPPPLLQAATLPAKSTKDVLMMDEAALLSYDNMIALNDLNEPTILHNLRQRFLKDNIYTCVV